MLAILEQRWESCAASTRPRQGHLRSGTRIGEVLTPHKFTMPGLDGRPGGGVIAETGGSGLDKVDDLGVVECQGEVEDLAVVNSQCKVEGLGERGRVAASSVSILEGLPHIHFTKIKTSKKETE